MELDDFLRETQEEVRGQIADRMDLQGQTSPYPELVFTELVTQHMSEIGMTFDPVVCHYSAIISNARLKLSGYAISEDGDQLDLFVCAYSEATSVAPIHDTETKTLADQCLRFLKKCAEGRLSGTMDESNDAYALSRTIYECYSNLDQIRIYVLTDRVAKAKNFKPREIQGKTIKLEVMDIERLFRHWAAGKPRDEIEVDFKQVSGAPLPCVYVPGEMTCYDYALTAIPGKVLEFVYDKYDARLLEANVRSFLSATGKINRGIRDTLRTSPELFMAYNNGVVLVVDEISLERMSDGGNGIRWIKGMQIVNGGQTTASIFFTKKKYPDADLARVRVPAKIIILKSENKADEENLISNISKNANSQNAVKQSDFSANKPFHVEIEKLAISTYCPDGISRWFYERAAGSYNVMLALEGNTPARLRVIKNAIPPARKITKTDLAKYIHTWEQKPHLVSLGLQKNFRKFMEMQDEGDGSTPNLPDVSMYKRIIATAILCKTTQKILRPMFPQSQGVIATYLVSLLANRFGNEMDLDSIWNKQSISPQLTKQIEIWAKEVNEVIFRSAQGKMITEWAKKPQCWEDVKSETYSPPHDKIPELPACTEIVFT